MPDESLLDLARRAGEWQAAEREREARMTPAEYAAHIKAWAEKLAADVADAKD